MKKTNSILLVGLTSIMVFILFSGLECNNNDPETPSSQCLYFRSYKLVWKETPVDPLDQPLNPQQHLETSGITYLYFKYKPSDYIEKVCVKEASVVDFLVEVKEEFKDQMLIKAYVFHQNIGRQIDNWEISGDEDAITTRGGITITGDPNGEETHMEIELIIRVLKQGSEEETFAYLENAVNKIQLDWAFTEY